MDPRERRVELAARGEALQRAELRQALGAQRRGDLRVELAQVERLLAQPGDDVVLGEPVLALVVERDRHDDLALGRELGQHVGLQAAHEAAPAQVPVQALLGELAAELAGEARARAEVLQAPDDAQLADELLGVVEHRRAGQREPQAVGDDGLRQPPHRLRALGLRVLAEVRLVDDERARAQPRELLAVGGDDLVVEDRDVGRRRHRASRPWTTATVRCGSQRGGLALPVELQRGRADDDRRDRRRRPRARRAPRRSCPGPARRRGTRAARRARSARPPTGRARARRRARRRPRRSARRSVGARARGSRLSASSCSARSSASARVASPSTATSCSARNASSGSTTHGSIGSGAPRSAGAGQALEGAGRRRGPRAPRGAGASPSTRLDHRQARGRRVLAALAARRRSGRRPPSMRAEPRARPAPRRPPRSAGRAARRPRARPRPRAAPRARVPARVRRTHQPRPSWRVVRHAPDPAAVDARQPGVDLRARRQLREAVEHLRDVHAAPVVDRRPPLARVPVEAPLRDAAHDAPTMCAS